MPSCFPADMEIMPREKTADIKSGPLRVIDRPASFGQHVYQDLRLAIVRGDLASGDRLIENRIAEAMGISRTPVREALHKLEREGLIVQGEKRGFVVSGFGPRDIEETFGIRSVLESYAAGLAAMRYRKGDLAPLVEKIDEFEECLEQGEMGRLVAINTEFHQLLYALSGNARLIAMIDTLRDQFYRFRKIILQRKTLARASHADHRKMLAVIRRRDVEKAERLVRQHILKGQAAVLADFDNVDKKG